MIGKDQLATTVSNLDRLTELGLDYANVVEALEVEKDDARYVAEQRALRLVLALRGDESLLMLMRAPAAFTVKLTDQEKKQIELLATAWLDGLYAGIGTMRPDLVTIAGLRAAAVATKREFFGED